MLLKLTKTNHQFVFLLIIFYNVIYMINFNDYSDEIGKIIVIIIIAPILLYKSFVLEDLLLGVLGVLLFIYDFYWFYQYSKKKKVTVVNEENDEVNLDLSKLDNQKNKEQIISDNIKMNIESKISV